jgi:hypothetical protein
MTGVRQTVAHTNYETYHNLLSSKILYNKFRLSACLSEYFFSYLSRTLQFLLTAMPGSQVSVPGLFPINIYTYPDRSGKSVNILLRASAFN